MSYSLQAQASHRRAVRRTAWLGMLALIAAVATVGLAVILWAPSGS